MITAGGENIAPVPIEEAVKAELGDIVSNVMLVGDNRKHLSIILTMKTELDSNGTPTNTLHPHVRDWLRARGCQCDTSSELSSSDNQQVREDIMKAIDAANSKAQSRAHRVQKYFIAPADFSVETGELTPTLKMKRHFVVKKYEEQISKLYDC